MTSLSLCPVCRLMGDHRWWPTLTLTTVSVHTTATPSGTIDLYITHTKILT